MEKIKNIYPPTLPKEYERLKEFVNSYMDISKEPTIDTGHLPEVKDLLYEVYYDYINLCWNIQFFQ